MAIAPQNCPVGARGTRIVCCSHANAADPPLLRPHYDHHDHRSPDHHHNYHSPDHHHDSNDNHSNDDNHNNPPSFLFCPKHGPAEHGPDAGDVPFHRCACRPRPPQCFCCPRARLVSALARLMVGHLSFLLLAVYR